LIEIALREREHAHVLEAEIAQRQFVALVILAEAAGAAGTGGHVHIALGDRINPEPCFLRLQEVGEIAGGKARGATLPDIGKLAPGEKIGFARWRQGPGAVAQIFEQRGDDVLRTPVQTAEQDLDAGSIRFQERPRGIGTIG
jgi:hypothetical protein